MESDAPNDAEAESAAPPLIDAEKLRAADFERPIRGLQKVDAYDLSTAYRKALVETEEGSDEHAVFAFLHALCGIGLQPDDRADVWKPLFSNGPRRSSLPEDFVGPHSAALRDILEETTHPALRARLADIVWTNDRKESGAAVLAVEAYCECGEAILAGTMTTFMEERGPDLLGATDIAHRALQIAYRTSKRGQMPQRPKDLVLAIMDTAKVGDGYVAFARAGEIALYYESVDPASAAADAEKLASSAPAGTYPMAVHGLWNFAAGLHQKFRDQIGRQRALKGAVQQTLLMRNDVKGSAAAEAHWVMDALQELRHVEGMEDVESELELELRRLQKASLKEMGSFKFEIDVKDEREAVEAFFSECSLGDGLREFALLERSRDPAQLRKDALETLDKSPLASMFSAVHLDEHGRTTAKSSGASLGGEPDESWFNHTINQHENLRRVHVVAGLIHPARAMLNGRFGLGERHLAKIVHASPFIPLSQAPLVTLGFARFFQGDFMSATHLLLPQLEPCLRYVLKQAGHDPAKRRDDATEEDLALSKLFERMRPQLDQVLGVELADEVDRLFNVRPGPALRHEIAHGQLSGGACFSEDVYYANWLLYRITILPLLKHWQGMIEPALEGF